MDARVTRVWGVGHDDGVTARPVVATGGVARAVAIIVLALGVGAGGLPAAAQDLDPRPRDATGVSRSGALAPPLRLASGTSNPFVMAERTRPSTILPPVGDLAAWAPVRAEQEVRASQLRQRVAAQRSRVRAERSRIADARRIVLAARVTRRPASGGYSGFFGDRIALRGYRPHMGVDYNGSTGDPIYAARMGTVIWTGWKSGYGYVIDIDHLFGYMTRYAHLSSIGVSVGEEVMPGDVIGRMGSTGFSTGSHLHFEVHHYGTPIDPLNWYR